MNSIHLLGDKDDVGVRELVSKLGEYGIEVLDPEMDNFLNINIEAALLCCTSKCFSGFHKRIIESHSFRTKILPCVFEGGELSGIYGDIKSSDFTKGVSSEKSTRLASDIKSLP